MACNIERQGDYELFYTTNDNRILRLDDDYYAIAQGQKGEMLVLTDSDKDKKKIAEEGHYKFVSFDGDAKFQDQPHLFLKSDGDYRETVIPRGLPDSNQKRKLFVDTDNALDADELESYLESPESGEGSQRRGRPGGGSMANVAGHLEGFDFPGGASELLDYAEGRDAPEAVIEQLSKLSDRSFESMAEVSEQLGEEVQKGRPPIDDYDELNVDDILDQIDDLDEEGIRKVRDYEQENYNRKTVLRKADQLLDQRKGEAPVEDYFDMTADEMIERIEQMEPARLESLEEYEKQHRSRKTVLEAIERRRN